MNDWQHTLFSGGDLSNYLIDRWDDITKERESATFDASLSKYILRLPELDLEKSTITKWGNPVLEPTDYQNKLEHHRQTFIIVIIPFEGDGNLLRYRPSGCTLPVPQGLLGKKSIQMVFEGTGSKDEAWKYLFTNDIATIDGFLEAVSIPVQAFNEKIKASVSNRLRTITIRGDK